LIGLTFIFHVFSALVTILLVYGLLMARRKLDFAKTLLVSSGHRVTIEWPHRFFADLAELLGATFAWSGSKSAPIKIQGLPWIKFHMKYPIRSLRLEEGHLTVESRTLNGEMVAHVEALQLACSGKLTITIVPSP